LIIHYNILIHINILLSYTMNDYSNIILSSALLGSTYLFSTAYKISMDRHDKKFSGVDLLNTSVMIFSGFVVLLTNVKAIKLLK
jgi:hypothetical protein